MLQGLSSSILSLFFLSMAVFLKELLDPRFCFLLTPSICFSSQPAFLETKMSALHRPCRWRGTQMPYWVRSQASLSFDSVGERRAVSRLLALTHVSL